MQKQTSKERENKVKSFRLRCSPVEFLVHLEKILLKGMLYTMGKIRVSGFRKSIGSVTQSWAKHFTDQNINALKIVKNSKTNEIFMVITWDLNQNKTYKYSIKYKKDCLNCVIYPLVVQGVTIISKMKIRGFILSILKF